MENYTFEKFWEDLNNGFELTYLYMNKRYSIYKTSKNSYNIKNMEEDEKKVHNKFNIITLKSLKEIFEDMKEIEYKI